MPLPFGEIAEPERTCTRSSWRGYNFEPYAAPPPGNVAAQVHSEGMLVAEMTNLDAALGPEG